MTTPTTDTGPDTAAEPDPAQHPCTPTAVIAVIAVTFGIWLYVTSPDTNTVAHRALDQIGTPPLPHPTVTDTDPPSSCDPATNCGTWARTWTADLPADTNLPDTLTATGDWANGEQPPPEPGDTCTPPDATTYRCVTTRDVRTPPDTDTVRAVTITVLADPPRPGSPQRVTVIATMR